MNGGNMKITLAILIVATAAAGAYAFDLSSIFGGSKPAPIKELIASTQPPAALPQAMAADPLPLNLPPADANAFIASAKPVVIDVRTPDEYASGHLEAATLQLDFRAPDFKDKLDKLDRNAVYLIYCRSGHRSGQALAMMKDMGFMNIHDIAGGITAWTAAGLPVVK
jgi:rhodanese-related sulfurtransferase